MLRNTRRKIIIVLSVFVFLCALPLKTAAENESVIIDIGEGHEELTNKFVTLFNERYPNFADAVKESEGGHRVILNLKSPLEELNASIIISMADDCLNSLLPEDKTDNDQIFCQSALYPYDHYENKENLDEEQKTLAENGVSDKEVFYVLWDAKTAETLSNEEEAGEEEMKTEDTGAQTIEDKEEIVIGKPVENTKDNGLPIITVNITDGSIIDMLDDQEHKTACSGSLDISFPEGYSYIEKPDFIASDLKDLKMEIRGRGNSSWRMPKRPFKIKLDKKSDLFGMGKNKHWVLLANYLDYTLLRDRVTSYLAGNMSFAFTPECVNVEVYMKDVKDDQLYYLGNYMLAEQVRVGENRLEIDELDENETDPTKITGGYLIQEGSQRHLSRDVFKTKLASLTLANDTPSFDTKDEGYENDTQMNYIREHIQHYEDALYGDDFINDQGLSYKDYADQLTAADYFLMNVISANEDAFATGSHYFYKVSDTFDESGKLKEMGKIYYGPIWDYDKCWGIDLTNSTDSEEGRYQTLRSFDPDDRWYKAMLTDPEFTALLKQRWSLFRADLLDIIADGGLIDQYYQENKASQADDFAFWFEGENVYQEEISDFKKRIAYRINWVDDHFDELNDMIHSVKCVVDGNVFSKNFYSIHDYVFLDTPQKEGCIFVGWLDEKGNVIEEVEDLSYDRVFTASFINKKDASKADEIYFERKEVYGLPGDHRWARYTLFPEDALDKSVIWESSDENVATVDEKGTLTLHALGRAKITATLASGVQNSYYVNVVNEKPLIETIQIPESITLKKGAHCQLEVRYVPEDAEYDFVSYGTDDIDIIRIDYNGVIKGLNKGSGVVQVRATYNDYQKHIEIAVEKECVVHVTDEEEYNCTDGSGKEWIRGSASGLAFEFKNSDDDTNTYDKFRKLYLDNHEADKNRYDTERGSLIVKLKPEYLNSLSKGEHILIAEFEDGKALTRFTINERPADTSYRIPVTGIR